MGRPSDAIGGGTAERASDTAWPAAADTASWAVPFAARGASESSTPADMPDAVVVTDAVSPRSVPGRPSTAAAPSAPGSGVPVTVEAANPEDTAFSAGVRAKMWASGSTVVAAEVVAEASATTSAAFALVIRAPKPAAQPEPGLTPEAAPEPALCPTPEPKPEEWPGTEAERRSRPTAGGVGERVTGVIQHPPP
jgi:hypothetical protein